MGCTGNFSLTNIYDLGDGCAGSAESSLLPFMIFTEISWSGHEVIKKISCSTQLSIKIIRLINVKMPTIVGILTFISMINKTSESLKARKACIFQHYSFYEQLKFDAQLS